MNKAAFIFLLCISSLFFIGCATNQTNENISISHKQPKEQQKDNQKNVPKSYVEKKGEDVIVHIIIDSEAEHIKRNLLEATAMLRTPRYLRREFKELPRDFYISSRNLKNYYDSRSKVYYYSTIFNINDIEEVIKKAKTNE